MLVSNRPANCDGVTPLTDSPPISIDNELRILPGRDTKITTHPGTRVVVLFFSCFKFKKSIPCSQQISYRNFAEKKKKMTARVHKVGTSACFSSQRRSKSSPICKFPAPHLLQQTNNRSVPQKAHPPTNQQPKCTLESTSSNKPTTEVYLRKHILVKRAIPTEGNQD